ncbi:MAG: hypothetical protein RLZZ360_163 [Candidatus Parcubacteria bacterium]|jgi:hypothetical protein
MIKTISLERFIIMSLLAAGFLLQAGIAAAATTGTLLPTTDGINASWTPKTGTTHYTMVDETACNGTTDYVSETTVGERDSYQVSLASVPANAEITSIAIVPCASRNSSGGGSSVMDVFYRFNGAQSADQGGYALTGTTPTALATTTFSGLSLINAASSTLEVGAVYTSGTKGARLSRLATVITYTPAVTIPTAPTNFFALATSTGTTTGVYAFWTDNSTNEQGFKLERSTDNVNFSLVTTTTGRTFLDTPVASGTYYYRVYAYNTAGNSSYATSTAIVP